MHGRDELAVRIGGGEGKPGGEEGDESGRAAIAGAAGWAARRGADVW